MGDVVATHRLPEGAVLLSKATEMTVDCLPGVQWPCVVTDV